MSVITTRALTRRYGRRIGVESIDLDVPQGSIYGFLGPNGAGKTTTIRVLLGFLRPSDGRAEVLGRDCWRESRSLKHDVGYLPGDLRLYPWMTARAALRLVGRIRRRDIAGAGARLLERFGLDADVPVRKMSRGMRQKLGIVLALAHEPRLLVLDEPSSGLDPLMRDELALQLRRLASRGHTVFFSSHTLSEVERICDRVAIIRAGRIVADEPLEALRRRARRQVTLEFGDAGLAGRTEPPPFLRLRERDGVSWHCELEGPAGPLVAWAAALPIADLTVSPPDLESMFRRFYRYEGDA